MLFLERKKHFHKETHILLMCFHRSLTKLSLYYFFIFCCSHSNDCVFMNLKIENWIKWKLRSVAIVTSHKKEKKTITVWSIFNGYYLRLRYKYLISIGKKKKKPNMSITLKQHNNCCCYGLFEKKYEFLFWFSIELTFP